MKCHWYLECTQKGTAKSSRKGNYGYRDAMEPVVNESQLHEWIVYTPTSNSIAKRNAYQQAVAWEHDVVFERASIFESASLRDLANAWHHQCRNNR